MLQCPLKVESEPTLKALAAANHMLMMITGQHLAALGNHVLTNQHTG